MVAGTISLPGLEPAGPDGFPEAFANLLDTVGRDLMAQRPGVGSLHPLFSSSPR